MSWKIEYGLLLLISTLIDYFSAFKIYRSKTIKERKKYLTLSISLNLILLIFFKYILFFIKNSLLKNFVIFTNMPDYWFILPVGISFYTFQTMGYSIDIYRKRIKPEVSFINFALFVSFFPQLVAGPIEKARRILPQLKKEYKFRKENISYGVRRIIKGFFKKIVIANSMLLYVDSVFGNIKEFSGFEIILGAFFFSNQVYCDFSGYADIAIGSSRLFGIKVIENFNFPIFSKSITDFWTRWHISLTNWFKEYLFPFLAPRKSSLYRKLIAIVTILILSGIWHGAKASYILWGILFSSYFVIGTFLSILIKKYVPKLKGNFIFLLFSIIVTNILLAYSALFFRANTPTDSIYAGIHCWDNFFPAIYTLFSQGSLVFFNKYINIPQVSYFDFKFTFWLAMITPFMQIYSAKVNLENYFSKNTVFYIRIIFYSYLLFLIFLFSTLGKVDFLYFRF